MLKGVLMVAMLAASYGVVYLMYGKQGIALRKSQGKGVVGACAGVALMLIIWALCLLLLIAGKAAGDTALAIGVVIAVPVVIVVMIITTRMRVKKALAAPSGGEAQAPGDKGE